MCACLDVYHMHAMPWRPEGNTRFLGLVTRNCEPLNMGAVNKTFHVFYLFLYVPYNKFL